MVPTAPTAEAQVGRSPGGCREEVCIISPQGPGGCRWTLEWGRRQHLGARKPPPGPSGLTRGLPGQLPGRGCGNPPPCPGLPPRFQCPSPLWGRTGWWRSSQFLLPHHRDGHHLEDFGVVVLSVQGHPGGPEAAFEADKYHFLCKAVKSCKQKLHKRMAMYPLPSEVSHCPSLAPTRHPLVQPQWTVLPGKGFVPCYQWCLALVWTGHTGSHLSLQPPVWSAGSALCRGPPRRNQSPSSWPYN